MALCLPLAVLIGYFLAEPMETGGVAILALALAVLSAPLVIRYHHPLLVASWNASIALFFLPGAPGLWMVLAFASFVMAVFNRATDPDKRFLEAGAPTKALLFLAAVVGVTALLTGGIGMHSFGSNHYGGRFYMEVFGAVIGYFALTSQRIPAHRAGLYVGLFFLSGITSVISNLIYMAGPPFYFLYAFFPTNGAMSQAMAENSLWPAAMRLGNLAPAGSGVLFWLLARYGVRGTFDYTKPWRPLLFILGAVVCLFSGFRSLLTMLVLLAVCVFVLEGLWRTRALPILLLAGLVTAAVVLPQSERLPSAVQRTLSFLPVKVDPDVADEARYSTEWRLQIWRSVLPDVPRYLFKGKGYTFDANDLARAQMATGGSFAGADAYAVAMEYHSGPLSVLIPFGLFGMLGFVLFLGTGLRVLYRNYRFGDPALHRVNTLLLAAFVVRTLSFFLIFGALHGELFWFTGILGLSISLNGGVAQPATEPEPAGLEAIEAA